MNPSFNLIDEPWIPVTDQRGEVLELGLKELFHRAHELKGLAADSPIETAALYRLLLAVLYRVQGAPQDTEDWEEMWERGRFDTEAVHEYLETWREHFDLFDATYPFYQWDGSAPREKAINTSMLETASGNNATLFDHSVDRDIEEISPARAARLLLTAQACFPAASGGMDSRTSFDAPWSRGIIFLAEGNNIFETLLFNLLPSSYLREFTSDVEDRPIWESDRPWLPDRLVPLGILDYLTWPCRALRFRTEERRGQTVVRELTRSKGLKLASSFLNPYHHYHIDKKRGYTVLRFSEHRSLWRDSAAFLRLRDLEHTHPPRSIHWIANLVADGVIEQSQSFNLMALGMASDQAKIDFYREDHLPVPPAFLQDDSLVEKLNTALEQTELVCTALQNALTRMARLYLSPDCEKPEGRKPDNKDVKNLIKHWGVERHYWSELEPIFYDFIRRLPNEPAEAEHRWATTLVETARSAFATAENKLPDNARGLRAAVLARGRLNGRLKPFLPQSSQKEIA